MLSTRRWYEPAFGPQPEGGCFGASFHYAPSDGVGWAPVFQLRITLRGRVLVVNLLASLLRLILLCFAWIAIYSVFPSSFAMRGGVLLDSLSTILFASVLGSVLFIWMELPAIPGVLWGALIWNHIGPEVGYFTSGITQNLRSMAGLYGVSIIVASAGLACDARMIRKRWPLVLALTFLPFLFEMTAHAFVAKELFSFPNYAWAFHQGAVFSGIAPGVILPGMQQLVAMKYESSPEGLFVSVYPAVVLEAVVAVWCVGFTADMTFIDPSASPADIAVKAILGPAQVLVGAAVGIVLALALHLVVSIILLDRNDTLWKTGAETPKDVDMKPALVSMVLIFQGTNIALIFGGQILGFPGGAAIAVATMALVVSNLWKLAPDNSEPTPAQRAYAKQLQILQQRQGQTWSSVAVPFLFSMTGSQIDLTKVFTADFFPRAAACFATGTVARCLVVFGSVKIAGFGFLDAALLAVAWLAKGAIQASLGGTSLSRSTTDEERNYGRTVLHMSMLATMVSAVVASAGVVVLGRRLLTKKEE